MKIKLIKSDNDYQDALKRLGKIFDAKEGSSEGDEAELLSILIEKYEDKHYPILPPEPLEAIRFWMEQYNMKDCDLARIIGYKSRVSEIFNGKRKLNLSMIRKLHEQLNIPYQSLMADY